MRVTRIKSIAAVSALILLVAVVGPALAAAPSEPSLSNTSVQENQPAGTEVGTFSATDPDGGTTFTYQLVGGTGDTDNGKFKIVGDKLTTRVVLDYEADSSLSIRARVTDAQGEVNRKVFTITVTDDPSDNANNRPTDIQLSNQTLAENQPAATVVGTLTATDPDSNQTFKFNKAPIKGTEGVDNPKFQVVGNELQTKVPLDYEDKSSLSVRLQVTDQGGLTYKETFTITVTDLNDPPSDVTFSNLSVAENSASGTTVGTASTTDPDAGDTHTYTLVAGDGDTDNGSFTIDGSTLKTNAVFDYETKNSYSIRVQTDDGNGGTFQKSFTVTVTDVNENQAPTDITFSNLSVAENSASGTTVGTASTTDPDAGDTHTYTLVAGDGDTDNGSFTIDGSTLKTNAVFDYETKNSYSIRVQTDDGNGGTFQKSFTVTVTDANDAPTDSALSNASIDENKASGSTIGTLSATDPDAGDTHTWSLVPGDGSTDNASFTIDSSTLKSAAVFNYEAKNSYSIRVRATDSANNNFEKVFTITIVNVNEAPVTANDSYSGAVGNTQFALGTSPSGPKITGSGANPKANDSDPEGDTVSCVAETVSSTGGGSATIGSDCTYTFSPGVGDKSQTDSFTYKATDGTLNGTGTIEVAIGSTLIWYVDRDAGSNGDGRSHSPLQNLAGINGAGGSGDSDTTNETIFLYSSANPYTGGLPLEAGQQLLGEPEGLTANSQTLVAAGGSNPAIQNASGTAITLAEGNTLRRVNVGTTSGDGISGTNVNAADIGGSSAISGVGGADFKLSGGNGTVTFGPTITNTAGRAVDIQNRTGGTTTLSGAISDSGGTGIILNSNSGTSTTNFTGQLTLSTGASDAFTSTGGGTVSSTASGSTISTTTGRALNVATAIGSGRLNFQSVSSNGAPSGIVLSGTGNAGGLTITGTGAAGTGGTIQNTTGPGISLSNMGATNSVSLDRMVVQSAGDDGIRATGVSGFTLANSTVQNNGNAVDERGIELSNVTGSGGITNSTLHANDSDNLFLGNTSGTLSSFNVTGNTIRDTVTRAEGNDNVLVLPDGSANMTVSITGNTFSNPDGDHYQLAPTTAYTGSMTSTFSNNTLTNTSGQSGSLGSGITIGGPSTNTISGNTITGAVVASMEIGNGLTSAGETLKATITNNQIGNAAAANSGGSVGISLQSNSSGTVTALLTGNTVRQSSGVGGMIRVLQRDGNGVLNFTATGNTVDTPGQFATHGIAVQSGAANGDTGTVCADVGGAGALANTVAGHEANGGSDLRVFQRFGTTMRLRGYTGGATDTAAVQTYLLGRNTATTASAGTPGGSGYLNTSPAGSACPVP
jgi:hypothetical protein